jgi:hypothetical protein
MKTKFLSLFGLTTLSNYREIEDRAKEYHKLISDLTLAIAEYEDKPKPSIEYSDYKKTKQSKSGFDSELWNEWYSIYCRNQYAAYKIRQLTKHPHLFIAFMNEFGSFDWESTYSYMKSVDWFWSKKFESPTIEELKDCVITLIPDDNFDYVGNGVSSGGFTVSLYYNENGEAVCKIKFNKL